jgi:hypothetical protein
MMCVLMRVRDPDALARACDLGLAMQLTNIARDIGEDARAGRVYLPLDWLDEVGISVDALFANPQPDPRLQALARRLLAQATTFYTRSEAGVPALPLSCRPGIYAARHVYDGIGGALARLDHDSVTHRARTTGRQKLGWLGLSLVRSGVSVVLPQPVSPTKPRVSPLKISKLTSSAVLLCSFFLSFTAIPNFFQAILSLILDAISDGYDFISYLDSVFLIHPSSFSNFISTLILSLS